MPGLEVAPADPEAMGRGTGFRVKLLTGWEKPAAGGAAWKDGPGRAGTCCPVSCHKHSEGCDDIFLRQDPAPCSGGGFACWLWVQRVSKARAVPRCSLLGPQHVHGAGTGTRARGSSHPGQLTGGAQGGPNPAPLVLAAAKLRGCGDIRAGRGAWLGLAPAFVGSRAAGSPDAAVVAERCLPWDPSPPWAGHGRDAQPREQQCCGGESGREGRGGQAGEARELQPCRGHFGAGCYSLMGSWELFEPKPPSPLRRGMLCTAPAHGEVVAVLVPRSP